MKQVAKKNDWVRIMQIILTPEERLKSLPESTRKVPLKCWINGFLMDESASIGDTVNIETLAGRVVSGTLYQLWPQYDHSFGRQQPTLMLSLIHIYGSVYVEWTKPGQGTCITFCLDACTPDHNSMENAAAAQAGSAYKSQNYLEDFKGTSASLLVVDDNEDNLNIIRTIFEDCSFSMDCVKSAKEALELLEKSSYDIIILDVMMPEMSGFELCQIIRKRYSHFELPVLLLTACDGAEEILTGFWSGANDYVVKPADRIELRTRVFSLITLKQSVKSALDNEMLFLQAQIRPHFLYNAFNTISAIALTDGVKASELIDDLAIYLRGCFGNDVNRGLVTIDTELGIVNSYVHICLLYTSRCV